MTRPDSPCIGVCDVLYKDICSGCGRHYLEVARWTEMTTEEKDAVWQRIETEATSWRFTTYKDRVK
jgi:predicted Fe-S protein YdhL (DUF1289 family)